MKKFLKILIIAVIAISLLAISIYILPSNGNDTIKNDGYTYKVEFEEDAEKVRIPGNDKNYLVSPSKGISLIVAKSPYNSDCGERGAKVADKVEIHEREYSVCRLNNSNPESALYTVDFQYQGDWHGATMFSEDMSTSVDKNYAKRVFASIRVVE